jgi:hypothetical protein
MKVEELRPCDGCGKSINPVFFRVRVEQHVIDQRAVQQHVGLATMFGGSGALANVFDSYGNDATKEMASKTVLLCSSCFCDCSPLAAKWTDERDQE